MSSGNNRSAAVVGAGLVGRLTALLLRQRYGLAVSLFDCGSLTDEDSCSFVAAGLLTPEIEAALGEPKIAAMGREAMSLWPQWLDPSYGQIDFSFVVARPQDAGDLAEFREKLLRRTNLGELILNTQAQLAELDGFFDATKLQGFVIPQTGYVDPVTLMHGISAKLLAAGVDLRWQTQVEKICAHSLTVGNAAGKTIESKSESFDFVFDTRGLGARSDLQDLRGVRGELVHIESSEINLNHAVKVLHPRFPVYIVPRGQGRYVIGATNIESELTGPPTVQSALELLGGIADLHHGFRQAKIVAMKSHLRPALPDNLPSIQVEPGLTRVNGLYRHGILLAPLLAESAVSQTLAGLPRLGDTK